MNEQSDLQLNQKKSQTKNVEYNKSRASFENIKWLLFH